MAHWSSALRAALVLISAAAPAVAQQASVTLSTQHTVWNEPVIAHIGGVGCSGVASEAVATQVGDEVWVVDIDLEGCSSSSTTPFSTDVVIGPLYPEEYTVRVHDAIRHIVSPPPPPLATAPLSAHPEASLDVDVPAVLTDAAPVTLSFFGPARSACTLSDGVNIAGRTIRNTFFDECPIIPIGGPGIFRFDEEVGPLAAGPWEVLFFDGTFERASDFETLPLHRETFFVYDADGCAPSPTALCLVGGRFRVEATWEDFAQRTGAGHPVPLGQGGGSTGLLWFFSPDNVELTVKVLDACARNNRFWVFISSGSTVKYTVTVTDTATGRQRSYQNALRQAAPLVTDTTTFRCGAP
ncbi:MAG TPA: hypothetical protein VF756_06100 [Thermoanaerobaculia bacterium]